LSLPLFLARQINQSIGSFQNHPIHYEKEILSDNADIMHVCNATIYSFLNEKYNKRQDKNDFKPFKLLN